MSARPKGRSPREATWRECAEPEFDKRRDCGDIRSVRPKPTPTCSARIGTGNIITHVFSDFLDVLPVRENHCLNEESEAVAGSDRSLTDAE